MFTVVSSFVDLKDKNHIYRTGDKYPRPGVKIDPDRVAELMGEDNGLKRSLIKEVKTKRKKADAD